VNEVDGLFLLSSSYYQAKNREKLINFRQKTLKNNQKSPTAFLPTVRTNVLSLRACVIV